MVVCAPDKLIQGTGFTLLIMDKRRAHVTLLVFDALAFWALYLVIDKWHEVSQDIRYAADSIELQSPFGLFIATLIIPIIHSQCLITVKSKRAEKIRNYAISGLFVLTLLAGFVFDHLINKEVTSAGYQYCASESETLTFSQFRVYVKGRPCQ